MLNTSRGAVLSIVLAMAISAAAEKKEFRYRVTPGATVVVFSDYGGIAVRPSAGEQVLVTATSRSDKIAVESTQTGNRIDVHTRARQKVTPEEASVDYELQVPRDASVSIRTAAGSVNVQNAGANLMIEADTSKVEIAGISNGHVKVRTVSGPVVLSDIRNSYVDVSSVSGAVTMNKVSGKILTVNTTASPIQYSGDFGEGGEYSLSSHSGNLEVALPAAASVALSARSVNGSVHNDFPFGPQNHPAAPADGRAFTGTANSGASSVRLRTFSGTIRVKKQ
jgi:DUF4097 and DUF4098 domain-containing protein YvlB